MRRVLFSSLLLALCACSAFAQKTKPWTEWSEKEAAKILNDSPWGQTQTEGRRVQAPSKRVRLPRLALRDADTEQRALSERRESHGDRPAQD